MKKFDFIKMHGLGNDFVIIDERHTRIELTHDEIISVANRHTGIGCDQLITINNDLESNLFIRFFKGFFPAAIVPIILKALDLFFFISLVSLELIAYPSKAALLPEG